MSGYEVTDAGILFTTTQNVIFWDPSPPPFVIWDGGFAIYGVAFYWTSIFLGAVMALLFAMLIINVMARRRD